MQRAAAFAVIAMSAGLACGNRSAPATKKDAAPADAPRPIDAPPDAEVPPAVLCTAPTPGTQISMRQIGQVSGCATLVTAAPGDQRMFVVEQAGRIRVIDAGLNLLPTPMLDISGNSNGPVVAGGEQGLLGLAGDPGYATNGHFYVDYTMDNPQTGSDPYLDVVERFTISGSDANVADPTSGVVLLAIPDYAVNHNAGMIEFGSDGYLYVSTGDGGAGGDPRRNGQNPFALLAKMLRIDPDHPAAGSAYGIPADNPFAHGGGAPEVFIVGARNPWRYAFDRGNGDLWIADVGQDTVEEVDYLPAGHQLGKNLGWSVYEGNTCCSQEPNDECDQVAPQQACVTTGLFFPQLIKTHAGDGWNAIIGGQVYRGLCYPDIVGTYFFTDNGFHGLSEATVSNGVVTAVDLPGTWPAGPASLHADSRGELFETTTTGAIYHLEASSGSGSGSGSGGSGSG